MKKQNPFLVTCPKDGWTCIQITGNSFQTNYTNKDRQFWLSEQKFNVTDFYGVGFYICFYKFTLESKTFTVDAHLWLNYRTSTTVVRL